MTTSTEALDELVRQHDMLRASMDHCEHLADLVDVGRGNLGELVGLVAALREAFVAHNHYEEQVLRPILRTHDAFGETRIEYMVADHVQEHRALLHRLDGPTGELRATVYSLRAHLAREERHFLATRMLRNDVVDSSC